MLYIVGIGPGKKEQMTGEALAALEDSEVIVGYSVYNDLVKPHFPSKTYVSTPMTKEEERCRMALSYAAQGKTTAMICSGDAGVYGMAGLVLELAQAYPEVEIKVVAGVSAALSGAALLGAPLIHDFAVISLSDRLTPWETIEKRLRYAVLADLCIVLYNPSSKSRADYLARACGILSEVLSEDHACGIARQIGRAQEESAVMTLRDLAHTQVDMFTTVFIGNSKTKLRNGRMITPRGYHAESKTKS